MKNVVFITRSKVFGGSGAPSSRNLLLAKMLADSGINVYLCSFDIRSKLKRCIEEIYPGIYNIGKEPQNERAIWRRVMRRFFIFIPIFFYCVKLVPITRKMEGETVIFQDWTLTKSIDISVLFIFRLCLGLKVFVDPNEYLASLVEARMNDRISILDFISRIKLKYFDYLLKFYSGLVIISSELEKKYSKLNKNFIRIPIVSDVELTDKLQIKPFNYGDTFKMAYFGTLQINKEGLDIICSTLNDLRKDYDNFEMHFYGNIYKPEKEMIYNLFSSLNGYVFYHGVISNECAKGAMKNYHLLISARRLITQTKYGFSTKLGEYMASGVPILVTNIGDNSQFIENGVNGFLVEPNSSDDFKNKLYLIIKHYEKESQNIACNALKTAKDFFDYRNYSIKFTNFLLTKKG